MSDSFSAKSALSVSGREYEIYRLDALQEKFDVARLPYSIKVLLENALRLEDGDSVTAENVETIAAWDANAEPADEIPFQPARVLMQDFTGVPAIVDLAAMRDAIDELGSDPGEDQPAGPGRPGDRPLGPGRRVRQRARLRHQRRPRLRAKPRALRVPALGPAGVRQLPRRPARDRDLPPGQPRVPEPGRLHPRRRRRRAGLPGHARRHRLPHDDGQRPRRARLGRGRDRGRGGDARPADLDAAAAGGRLPARRRAARGRHRDRPGADRHRDAARARRGLEVRRVLRPRPAHARARRPGDDREHVAGVRLDLRDLPGRPRDAALPRVHRAPDRDDRARRRLRARAGDVPRRGLRGPDLLRHARARSGQRRALDRRAEAPPGPDRARECEAARSSSRWPSSTPTPPSCSATAATTRSRSRFPPRTRPPRTTTARPASRASPPRPAARPRGDRRARGEPGDGRARGRRARSSSTTAGW